MVVLILEAGRKILSIKLFYGIDRIFDAEHVSPATRGI